MLPSLLACQRRDGCICQVDPIDLICGGSIFSRVFFWPEEDRVPSVGVDDVGFREGLPVHLRHERLRPIDSGANSDIMMPTFAIFSLAARRAWRRTIVNRVYR